MNTIGILGINHLTLELAALFAGTGARVLLFGEGDAAARALLALARHPRGVLFMRRDLMRIEPLELPSHAPRLHECAWIIDGTEDVRRDFSTRAAMVAASCAPDAVFTVSTSHATRAELAVQVDPKLRARFFITHFFYPPRRVKLVELVAGAEVDPTVCARVAQFLEERLGKGVVYAHDTPNFIAERIGIMDVMHAMHLVQEQGWPIEAVDTVMGPPLGRPAHGIFSRADMIGIDAVAAAATSAAARLAHDPRIERFRLPQYLQGMIVRGWTGKKAGQGFYTYEGAKRCAFDPVTQSYRPQLMFMPRSIAESEDGHEAAARLRRIAMSEDPGGEIAWNMLASTLTYAAEVAHELADEVSAIDRAMRWGYGWKLGPFEMWDVLGWEHVCARLIDEGHAVPKLIRKRMKEGRTKFYAPEDQRDDSPQHGSRGLPPHRALNTLSARRGEALKPPSLFSPSLDGRGQMEGEAPSPYPLPRGEREKTCDIQPLTTKSIHSSRVHHAQQPELWKNRAGALRMEDGNVGVLEFYEGQRLWDASCVEALGEALRRLDTDFNALVVAHTGDIFPGHADYYEMLMKVRVKRWKDLAAMIETHQALATRLRASRKPIVFACAGHVRGVGLEFAMASPLCVAWVNSEWWCTHVLTGLIPAAGGCAQFLICADARERARRSRVLRDEAMCAEGGPHPKVRRAFDLIAGATRSLSALDAQALGLCAGTMQIVMDRERLVDEAVATARVACADFMPHPVPLLSVPGRGGYMAMAHELQGHVKARRLNADDAAVYTRLAHVLAGGDRPTAHETGIAHIMELEREAWLALIAMPRTQKKMEQYLKTGRYVKSTA